MGVYSVLWPIHAILMGVSFAAMATGIIIAVFLKKKKWRLEVHKNLGYGGAICAVAALVLAVVMISLTHGAHISSIHAIFGTITIVFIIIAPALATIMYKSKAKPQTKKGLRIVHIYVGVIALALMTVTIFFGLRIAGII